MGGARRGRGRLCHGCVRGWTPLTGLLGLTLAGSAVKWDEAELPLDGPHKSVCVSCAVSRQIAVVTEDKLLLAAAVISAASYVLDQSAADRVRSFYA